MPTTTHGLPSLRTSPGFPTLELTGGAASRTHGSVAIHGSPTAGLRRRVSVPLSGPLVELHISRAADFSAGVNAHRLTVAGSDLGAGTRLYWPALVAAYDGRPVGDYSPRRRRWPCVGSTRPPRGSSRCCDTQSVARPAVGDGGLQPLRALPASGRPPSLTKHAAYHRRPQQMFGSVDHAGHSQKGGRNLGVGFRRGLDA